MISPKALVLVAYLPAPRDFEIARLLGWYRIPLRKAPKVVGADLIAFYQGSSFGENHRWRIETFAPMLGYEMTTRAELLREEANHPRAREEYYKLQLGPVESLAAPITAGRWKRLTFLYTTGERLLTAQTTRDLVVRDDERDVLWKSLRERALYSGAYRAEELPEIPLDPAILALLGLL
jgi:hypothetical protein